MGQSEAVTRRKFQLPCDLAVFGSARRFAAKAAQTAAVGLGTIACIFTDRRGPVPGGKVGPSGRRIVRGGTSRSKHQIERHLCEQTGKTRLSIYRSISAGFAATGCFPLGTVGCRMSPAQVLADLHAAVPLVGPSLLACDFANLQDEIRRVEAAGAQILHLDVMDGHFVPNISIGVPIVEAVRRVTDLPLDVHLMISEPGRYLKVFRRAGADLITIHIEAVAEPRKMLEEIRSLGAAAGITLNPPTPLEKLEDCLPYCDLVLVMSVMAGFGGQQFDTVALEKLRRLRAAGGRDLLLSVDGGINHHTIAPCAEAGADLFIAGTTVFSSDNYLRTIEELTSLARSGRDVKV